MAIIHQKDKRSGITYVYESISQWDKEKKQSRSKRRLIGRLDEQTGEVVPTDGRCRKRSPSYVPPEQHEEPDSTSAPAMAKRLFCGATYLLDQIGALTGVTEDLKACFPDTYRQILSIVYYLILEDHSPLFRFHRWERIHRHPYGEDITSQRSSELFQSVTEEAKERFFRRQANRRVENEFWAYDTTSISSYSECLRQVRFGHNKDHDSLPQINLALLFGEQSGLPFYYRKIAGNIPDVKTIHEMIRELDVLDTGKVKLVMDRGFYSAANVNALYKAHLKFILGTSSSLRYVRDFIQEIGSGKDAYDHYCEDYELFMFNKTIAWDYEQVRPYKGDVVRGERRMYLHLYYNPDQAAEDSKSLSKRIAALKRELLEGKRVAAHQKDYDRFFVVKTTPVRGISVTVKQDAIDQARERYGFFALISNEVKDPLAALQLYRTRDAVEKAFWDVKDRLNCKRTLVSSETGLEGKLFVEFVALIYLSYIKKQMEANGLFRTYTLNGVLDELDAIECLIVPGKAPILGEVLKRQEQLYLDLGVKPLLAKQVCGGG